MVQSPWCTAAVAVVCCFLSSEGASYAWVWLFFTSNLIAVIKKSTSSDSQWVCVGWLERFDWMWNKQGLPQCTAKTIKWSLWGRPSRLWWLRAGHESVFLHLVFVLHLSLSIYIYICLYLPNLCVCLSSNPSLSLCTCLSIPFLLICLFFVSIRLSLYLSVYLSVFLSSNASFYLFLCIYYSVCLSACVSMYSSIIPFQPFCPACLAIYGCNYQLYIWWGIVLFTHCHKLVKHGHQF